MTGLNRNTGAVLDANSSAHLAQSIGDILTTPLSSRPMRRQYGSEIPDLVDQPLNPLTRMRIFAAAAVALLAWEPRLLLKRVSLGVEASGAALLRLEGVRTDLPRRTPFSVQVPIRTA